ncbi:MAG: sulfatase-like hydrolase/transferase [Acidobacteriota bacterium]|nr:sulfatase-like hydrolase/transferase [Acidobacteriota bacterium]
MPSDMNRRSFLGFSSASLLAGAAGSLPLNAAVAHDADATNARANEASPVRRPNIVIFMPDEMRADSLACYGNAITKTPNLDRLAQQGTRFENCHVQFPVCGASRCALLTGWPTSVRGHRSLYYFLRPEEPNLFRYLRRAGYDVFWFGKNDALAAQSFYDSVTEWSDAVPMAGTRPPMHSVTPGSLSMLFTAGGDRRATADYTHLQMGIEILKRKESEKPFCIFLPLNEPHPPYTAPEDFYDMYSPRSLPPLAPPGLKRKPDFHEGIRAAYGLDKLDDATFRNIRSVYYGQVSYSDWLLGELLEAIDATGHTNDTAVFVTSDHGDYAGDYGLVEKWPSGLEDCLTHVPLIARIPGGKPGVKAQDTVEMYDVMQTCLDIAGVPAEEIHTHFARSLLPQLFGGTGDRDRAAFCEGGYNIYEPQCFEPMGAGGGPYAGKIRLQNERPVTVSRSAMIRTRVHKLIMRPQGQCEFYNVGDDPSEMHNLYGDMATRQIQDELQLRLLNHFINTTGVAPKDKDARDCPPFYPTQQKAVSQPMLGSILDK